MQNNLLLLLPPNPLPNPLLLASLLPLLLAIMADDRRCCGADAALLLLPLPAAASAAAARHAAAGGNRCFSCASAACRGFVRQGAITGFKGLAWLAVALCAAGVKPEEQQSATQDYSTLATQSGMKAHSMQDEVETLHVLPRLCGADTHYGWLHHIQAVVCRCSRLQRLLSAYQTLLPKACILKLALQQHLVKRGQRHHTTQY